MIPKVTSVLSSLGMGSVSKAFNSVTGEVTKAAGSVVAKLLANTLDDLRSGLERHGGLARTNRFSVFMKTPNSSIINTNLFSIGYGLSNGYIQSFLNDPRDIGIMCESATLPSSSLNTVDYTLEAHTQKMVTGFSNSSFTMSFIVTNDYFIPRLFKSWESSIIDRKTNRIKYKDSYTENINVVAIDENNIPNYIIRINKAFPVNVSEITYDENEMNNYVKCTVTFEYEDFEEYPITEIFGDLGEALNESLQSVKGLFGNLTSSDTSKIGGSGLSGGITSSPLPKINNPFG